MFGQDVLSATQAGELLFYPKRWKMLLGVAGSLIFVIAGIWMISFNQLVPFVIGFLSVGFFGLCGVFYLVGLVKRSPTLLANEKGVSQKSFFITIFVAWEEISAIVVTQQGRIRYLAVYLSDTGHERFATRYPLLWSISHLLGFQPALTLSPLLLPVPAQRVLETLQENYQHKIDGYNIVIG